MMKKSNTILIVVFIIAAIIVFGYAYLVFSKRYSHQIATNTNTNQGSIIDDFSNYLNGQSNQNTNDNLDENSNLNENGNENVNANSNTNSPNISDISNKDCDNNCSQFKDNPDNYKYCQEVCGIIPAGKKNSEADCANLTGLEKDYCYRDLAVSKTDISICYKVSDKKLQTVCRNRVTEDIIK